MLMSHRAALQSAFCIVVALVASLFTAAAVPAATKLAPVYTGLVKGVAVGGYDAVAYHTVGKAVVGNPAITLEHEGVAWRFASEANRELFRAEPARYAPQYGGYCAYAVSQGYTAKGDPKAWSIVGGKLYLNYTQPVKRDWDGQRQAFITLGDKNWPKVLEK